MKIFWKTYCLGLEEYLGTYETSTMELLVVNYFHRKKNIYERRLIGSDPCTQNIQKTCWAPFERLMCVKFTSCIQGTNKTKYSRVD